MSLLQKLNAIDSSVLGDKDKQTLSLFKKHHANEKIAEKLEQFVAKHTKAKAKAKPKAATKKGAYAKAVKEYKAKHGVSHSVALKKVSAEFKKVVAAAKKTATNDFMDMVDKMKEQGTISSKNANRSESELRNDASRTAKGIWRTSKTGKRYREYRANRTDETQGGYPKLAKGGKVERKEFDMLYEMFPDNWEGATDIWKTYSAKKKEDFRSDLGGQDAASEGLVEYWDYFVKAKSEQDMWDNYPDNGDYAKGGMIGKNKPYNVDVYFEDKQGNEYSEDRIDVVAKSKAEIKENINKVVSKRRGVDLTDKKHKKVRVVITELSLDEVGWEQADADAHKSIEDYAKGGKVEYNADVLIEDKKGNVISVVKDISIERAKEIRGIINSGGKAMLDYALPFSKGGNLPKGGSVKKKGRISVVNEGEVFDAKKYPAIMGDFDNDGLLNADDPKPRVKGSGKKQIEQVKFTDTFDKLLTLKEGLDGKMNLTIDELDEIAPKGAKIYARTKTPYSILKKLVDKRLTDKVKGLTDLVGTTIAVDNYKDLVAVNTAIAKGNLGEVVEREDMYKKPKAGYRAIHFLVDVDGTIVEIQLKTKRMKQVNEVSHEFYKNGNLNGAFLKKLTSIVARADKGEKSAIRSFNSIMKNKTKLKASLTK